MKFNFEKLEVYRDAIEFAEKVNIDLEVCRRPTDNGERTTVNRQRIALNTQWTPLNYKK